MKKFTFTVLAVAGLGFSSHAQFGGLMQKASGMAGQAKSMLPKASSSPAAAPASSPPAPAATPAAAATPAPAAEAAPASVVVADLPIEGTISAAHTRNMGKIVFTTTAEALLAQPEKEEEFIKSFTLGVMLPAKPGDVSRSQQLFARAYLPNSLQNMARKITDADHIEQVSYWSTFRLKVYLDGEQVMTEEWPSSEISADERNSSVFTFPLENTTQGSGMMMYNLNLNNKAKLPEGSTHRFRVELLPVMSDTEGPVVATGELELKARPVPVHVISKACLPAAAVHNAVLEAKVLQAFKAKGWPETPKAVRITRDWYVVRNELTGIITRRNLIASVGSTEKGECRTQSFMFAQDHDGNKFSGNVYLLGVGEDQYIRCECLK